MKLAILMDSADESGPAKQLLALIPLLSECGVDAHLIVFQAADKPESEFAALVKSLGLAHTVLASSGRFDGTLVSKLSTALRAVTPDIVQTHGYRPTALIALLRLGGRTGWRWIAFFHGATRENMKVRLYHAMDNILMRLSDRIVVVARSQERLFRGPSPGVSLIHNAVLMDTASSRDKFSLGTSEAKVPRIAVVGRLSHEKGVDVALLAMRVLASRGVAFITAVVGDGIDRAKLEQLRDQLGLSSQVRFVGRVSPVAQVYDWCDLVVMASRSEGMPNVLLEAVKARRRVVATSVGNIAELVGDSHLALVVPSENPDALAVAIEQALLRPASDADEKERAEFLGRYSIEHRAEEHLRLYLEIIS